MSRASVVVALVLTGAGMVLFADGPAGIERLARLVWERAGVILLVLAGAALITNVAPKGTMAGPLALGAIGAGIVMWGRSPAVWQLAGGGMVVLGGWLTLVDRGGGGCLCGLGICLPNCYRSMGGCWVSSTPKP
jgi:hypothetical protein